ncbi:MAG: helix-turn-helix domain-containing protein [Lentisphaeria bacterium]|nr:helix-turn-helix domain-containing protein [Lentisphaeria bacterium]
MSTSIREFHIKDYQQTNLPLAVWKSIPNQRHEPPHRHDCYEIMFILNGAGVCIINDQHYSMNKGSVFFIRPEDIHSFQVDLGTNFFNVIFTENMFTGNNRQLYLKMLSLFEDSRKITLPMMSERILENTLQDIVTELSGYQLYSSIASHSLFIYFIVLLLRNNLSSSNNTEYIEDDLKLSRVFNYIAKHIDEKISLTQLSKIVGYTPKYFSKFFKKITGISVSAYIIRCRIELAQSELKYSNKTLSEIAYEHGFCDATHFSKTFTKIIGVSPSMYRQNVRRTFGETKQYLKKEK